MASHASSPIRYLGFVTQQESDSFSNGFELDESEVIWSSSSSDFYDLQTSDPIDSVSVSISVSPPSSTHSNSPSHHHHRYHQEKFGLSAALSMDSRPLIQRKPSLNPSISASTAVRTIPPVPVPRSGWSSDDSSSGKFHQFNQSAPVNVPIWSKNTKNLGFFEEPAEDDWKDEEMLPPHEIVARSHVTTFSVFEGVGRTLKGRDMRRVRNAVWQKTGRNVRNGKLDCLRKLF